MQTENLQRNMNKTQYLKKINDKHIPINTKQTKQHEMKNIDFNHMLNNVTYSMHEREILYLKQIK